MKVIDIAIVADRAHVPTRRGIKMISNRKRSDRLLTLTLSNTGMGVAIGKPAMNMIAETSVEDREIRMSCAAPDNCTITIAAVAGRGASVRTAEDWP